MAGMSNTLVDKIVNATTPTGASGVPGTWTALSASAMKVKLTSTASSATASGTELTGTGYASGGQAIVNASTPSSAGSGVTLPATAALSWTNTSGGAWSIVSFELLDAAAVRTWFGNFTGTVSVPNGNTFQVGVAGISVNAS